MVKLTVTAYTDATFRTPINNLTYQVLINPDTFSRSIDVEYGPKPWINPRYKDPERGKFIGKEPEKFSVNLIFDATGAFIVNGVPLKDSIDEQIASFQKVVLTGNVPNYVMLSYGTILFRGRIESLKVTYTLFRPDATPVRAKAVASFIEDALPEKSDEELVGGIYKALMTAQVEGSPEEAAEELLNDPKAYPDLMINNRIKHIRAIKAGTILKR